MNQGLIASAVMLDVLMPTLALIVGVLDDFFFTPPPPLPSLCVVEAACRLLGNYSNEKGVKSYSLGDEFGIV